MSDRPPRSAGRPAKVRPTLERLDDRDVPALLTWDAGGGDGLWSNALNWSADRLPAAGDDVTIDAPGAVTFAGGTTTVGSLTVRGDTLVVTGGSLTTTGKFAVAGGTLDYRGGEVGETVWLATGSALRLNGGTGAAEFRLDAESVRLSGTVAVGQTVSLTTNSGRGSGAVIDADLLNNGTFRVIHSGGNDPGHAGVRVEAAQFVNSAGGRFEVPAGGSVQVVLDGLFVNRGTFMAGRPVFHGPSAGGGLVREFRQEAGSLTLVPGAKLTALGTFRQSGGAVAGEVLVDRGTLELTGGTAKSFSLHSGILAGTVGPGQAVRAYGGSEGDGRLATSEDVSVFGTLQLGDAVRGRSAHLHIAAGASLTVEPGGRVTVPTDLPADAQVFLFGRVVNRGDWAVGRQVDMAPGSEFVQEAGTLTIADRKEFALTQSKFRMRGGDVFGEVRLREGTLELAAEGAGTFYLSNHMDPYFYASPTADNILTGAVAAKQEVIIDDGAVTEATGDLVNRGLIRLDSTARQLLVPNGSLVNESTGRIQATFDDARNGGARIITARSLDNRGHIVFKNAAMYLTESPVGSARTNTNSGFLGLGLGSEFRYTAIPFVNTADGVITGARPGDSPGQSPSGGGGSGGGGGSNAAEPNFTNLGLLDNVVPGTTGFSPSRTDGPTDPALPVVIDIAREPYRLRVTYATNGVGIREQWARLPENYRVTTAGGRTLTPSRIPFDANTDTIWLEFADALPDEPLVLRINSLTMYDNRSVRLNAVDYVLHFGRHPLPGPQTVAPTVGLDLQAGSDTGPSDTDDITQDDTPTFDVAVNQAGRIELDVSGDGVPDRVVDVAAAGVYELVAPPQADGRRRVTATFTPVSGAAPVSAGLDVTIGAAPVAVTLDLQPGSDSGPSDGDNVTSARLPKFDVTVDRAGHLELDVDGDGDYEVPLDVPAAGTYTFTPRTEQADGRRTVAVRFWARTGGTARATLDVTIDTRPPALDAFIVQGGAAQRSMVGRTAWAFTEGVNLAPLVADPDALGRAFRLMRYTPAGGWQPVPVTPAQFRYDPGARTLTWDVDSFSGTGPGLRDDGFYQWQVYTAYITDAAGNPLAGGAVLTQTFHRLHGDFNGDRVVDAADLRLLEPLDGSTPGRSDLNAAFDLDGDGKVTAKDRKLLAGYIRGGRRVVPPRSY